MEAVDLKQLFAALSFAAGKHRDQRRKDREASPYINHPIALAEVLARMSVTDPVVLQAAILHDTIEDTETTPDEIEEHFGTEVSAVVEEVTDDKALPKAVRKQLQLEHAAGLSDRAKLIKLADKICNVLDVTHSPPPDWDDERRRRYLDWSAGVVEGCRGVHPGLEEYFGTVLAEGRRVLAADGLPGAGSSWS
jgi:GTP diphosphokinase / guanosine-3',5'-bis(diphosphate) 3'-diphosphatase